MVSALALLCVVAAAASWGHALGGMFHSEAGRYDFSTYYAAAAALHTDPHANIYSAAVLAPIGDSARVLVRPPLPYVYPPLFAIALSPLTALSFQVLSRLWLLFNALAWLGVTLLLAREVYVHLGEPLRQRLGTQGVTGRVGGELRAGLTNPAVHVALALAALVSLLWTPLTQTLLTGQIDLLVLVPLALVPELTRRRHERWVGVLIALAAMLKFTPAILLVYLALRRRWHALGAAVLTLAALALGSAALVGPANLARALSAALRTGSGDAALGQNEALVSPLHGIPVASFVVLAALALVLCAVLVSRRHAVTSPKAPGHEEAAYGVALCALLLLAPTAWVHHYAWMLPAALLALSLTLAHTLRTGHGRAAVLVAALAYVFLGVALPYAWDTDPHPAVSTLLGMPLRPVALELRALGSVLVLGLLARTMRLPASLATASTDSAPSQVQADVSAHA